MVYCTHYINLSGGIDSTFYLWRWLLDNPDKRILVHHCLYNESRKIVEKQATDHILDYFKSNGLNNFSYVESTFTRKGIAGNFNDIVQIGFMSGLILSNKGKYPYIKNILLPYCFEETPIIRSLFAKGCNIKNLDKKHRTAKFIHLLEFTSSRSFVYEIPHINKRKQEMIAVMPEELYKLTWFCRSPRNGAPCKSCFNCRRVLNIFQYPLPKSFKSKIS